MMVLILSSIGKKKLPAGWNTVSAALLLLWRAVCCCYLLRNFICESQRVSNKVVYRGTT